MPLWIVVLLVGAAVGAWMLAALWGAVLLGGLAIAWLICFAVATSIVSYKLRRNLTLWSPLRDEVLRVTTGGVFGGAALGRYVVKKWRLRGVEEKHVEVLHAMKALGDELADALARRAAALEEKLVRFDARYRIPPWLDSILPFSHSMIRTGIRRRFRREIQAIYDINIVLGKSIPKGQTLRRQWVEQLLQLVHSNPVLSREVDSCMAIISIRQGEYQNLLKKKGLVAPAPA